MLAVALLAACSAPARPGGARSEDAPAAAVLRLTPWAGDARGLAAASPPLAEPAELVGAGGARPAALARGDFDGDGAGDVAAAWDTPERRTLVVLDAAGSAPRRGPLERLPPRVYVRALYAADLVGDARDELLAGYARPGARGSLTGVAVLELDRRGRWRRRWRHEESGAGGVTALAAADLDRDGVQDVVALGRAGRSWLFLGAGDGGFVRVAPSLPAIEACDGRAVGVRDLDGDGRLEVAARWAAGDAGLATPRGCLSGGGLEVFTVEAVARN